jgi:hypothetical protein
MSGDEERPFRFEFDGIQPIDAAFSNATDIPVEDYERLSGEALPDDCEEKEIGMSLCWDDPKITEALLNLHTEKSADLKAFAERICSNLGNSARAKYTVAILCLGVVAGRNEAKILETYVRQGLEDLGTEPPETP